MLYSEFVSGTGCRENAYNYDVYMKLDALYMNSDISKEDVYAFAKKIVDNSETEDEKQIRTNLEAELKAIENDISYFTERKNFYKEVMQDNETAKFLSRKIKELQAYKERILFVLR